MNDHIHPLFADILNSFASKPREECMREFDEREDRLTVIRAEQAEQLAKFRREREAIDRQRQDEMEKRERHMRGCTGEQPW